MTDKRLVDGEVFGFVLAIKLFRNFVSNLKLILGFYN
jgi:hypothetical protein